MDKIELQIAADKRKAVDMVLNYFGDTDAINSFGAYGWFETQLGYHMSIGTKVINLYVVIHADYFDMGNNAPISRTGYFDLVADCSPIGLQNILNLQKELIVISKGNTNQVVFEYTYNRSGFSEKPPVIHNLTYNYEEVLESFCEDMITNLQGPYLELLQMANNTVQEPNTLQSYLNKNGNSNVEAYKIGRDYIEVKFFGTQKIYRYSYRSASKEKVEKAKSLAIQGFGLNSYIMRCMKYDYEK